MTTLTDKELDDLMQRVWERITIKMIHTEVLLKYPYMNETLDKCNCGKKRPPKK